jgi:mono/diheme cytochrome c family protein
MRFRRMAIAMNWMLVPCAAVVLMADAARAQDTAPAAERAPKFDKAYLSNTANINAGSTVWTKQCRHCHGKSAYPGKAPKLNPGGYTPDFVFDRVTNGFRGMPPWKEVFTLEERKAVVAYIKSESFSP